jgi:uncharacterized ubiquitin-like protein YukD
VLNNFDKGKTYAVECYDGGSISVSDQTLDEVTVVISYKDGETITYVWSSEDINTADFNGTFVAKLDGAKAIAQSNKSINIRVTAKDKAGNIMEGPYTDTGDGVETDTSYNFYVTTKLLIRFYANKGLFYGTIAGVVVLAAGGAGFAAASAGAAAKAGAAVGAGEDTKLGRRKKKEENQK